VSYYPADSTHARELRDRVDDQECAVDFAALHDAQCVDGWLGEDAEGRPQPCPVCKPHLARFRRRLREQAARTVGLATGPTRRAVLLVAIGGSSLEHAREYGLVEVSAD
jgi:hypothetical protein